MPFTPFHLGPALIIGLPLRKRIHAPTFIIANVIVDIEPFLVLTYNLNYPLHGYLHTIVGAIILGLTLSCIMYVLRGSLDKLFKLLKLVEKGVNLKGFVTAGVGGTLIHVLLDSPIYSDIRPFYPLDVNPLYNPSLTPEIYLFCTITIMIGLVLYLIILIKEWYGRV